MSLLKNRWLLLLLCSSVFSFTLILGDPGSIIGNNLSTPMDESSRERLYLNIARPAPCNGTIRQFGYCYYGSDDDDRDVYRVLLSIYRLVAGNSYTSITNTVSIIKRTPLSEVPLADALLPGFNCDTVELEESVQVLEGDVIGACVADNDFFEELDVVSESNNGDLMLYIDADDINDCESLPVTISDNLRATRNRILHIFAEIFPDTIPTTSAAITAGAVAGLSREETTTIIISISSSLLFIIIVAVIITVTVGACCFVIGKRRRSITQSGTRSGQFTPNVTYNIREQVICNEDRHSESSGMQSSAHYYDYIPTTRRAMPLSEHHIARSSAKRNATCEESRQITDSPSSTVDDDNDYVISSCHSC